MYVCLKSYVHEIVRMLGILCTFMYTWNFMYVCLKSYVHVQCTHVWNFMYICEHMKFYVHISSLVILCTCTYICESMLLFDDIWWCLFCTRPTHSVDCFYIANLYIMWSYSSMNVCMVSIKYQFIVFSLIRRCGWRFDHVISIKKT